MTPGSTPSPSAPYTQPAAEVARELQVDPATGLATPDARARKIRYGANQLTVKAGMSPFRRFLLQFAQPLMYVMLIAAGITAALGEWVDCGVLLGVVFANAIVGYIQEGKAEKALAALARMVITECTVKREGLVQRIDAVDLVPGDVVLLQSGDRVPADLRFTRVRSLQIDESALTGESVPVEKQSAPLEPDTPLAERSNVAYAGTLVTFGQAEGIVWATGDSTETGRIAQLIESATDISTPLTRQIARFSRIVLWVILSVAAVSFVIGLTRGQAPGTMFMTAVALAAGAVPEGLPAAVTITLALGVSRMAKRRAIIRKLPAVEALGSTTVICSDKTGTLTENQMTVRELFAGGEQAAVTGTGYSPKGEFQQGNAPLVPARHPAFREVLLAGLLNNDSRLVEIEDRRKVEGDPTEAALIVAAEKAGLLPELGHFPRVDVIPFESEYQYMVTLHEAPQGRLLYMKGSVERVLAACTTAVRADGSLGPLDAAGILAAVNTMASSGLRVLAFARGDGTALEGKLEHTHVKTGLTFLGVQGMIDPPRNEAIVAIGQCQQAGIAVKMITGDHALTATCIAEQLGLRARNGAPLKAVTGRDLEQVPPDTLPEIAETTAVFARVAPEQKLQLVRALQSRHHVVAMTGDGVNDAPALKQADIGIAMGITGTDVAKGAADMLLTDDNFASIEAAVEEGRGVFDNLTKFIAWTLPTNAGEAMIIIAAIILNLPLPTLPSQFLWINLSTSVLLGMTLAFEANERDLMKRRPRDPRRPILDRKMVMRTGLVALIMLVGAFSAYLWEQRVRGQSLAAARTSVVNVIVMVEVFYLFNCRSLVHSLFSVKLSANRWVLPGIVAMILAQIAFVYSPLMQRLFHTEALDLASWIYAAGVGLAACVIVEIEKAIRSRYEDGS